MKRGGLLMARKRRKQFFTLLLSVVMLTSMIQVNAFAMSNDLENHWAENAIQTWIDQGLVNGYPDGSFRPDANITRAEYMALVNNAFDFSQETSISFSDVKPSDWYHTVVRIAVDAGYIGGYPDNTIKPNQPITRQEAATIIVKIQGLSENPLKADDLTDGSSIENWSKGYIGAVVEVGYMMGYPDGSFKAKKAIKRGEAVVALNNTIKDNEEVLAKSIIYDIPGTYGPSQGKEVVEGTVMVKADKVILQNLHIKGNLIIAKEVADGEVTLNNIVVEGDTFLDGGGTDSIYINGGSYKSIIVRSTPGGGIRIIAVDVNGLEVVVAESAVDHEILLEGIFEKVTVEATGIKIETRGETRIGETHITETAPDVTIQLSEETTIEKVTSENTSTTIEGSGTVTEPGDNVTVNDGVTVILTPSTDDGDSGGGAGSSTPSTVAVTAINVTGDAVVGATLTAAPTPSDATGHYQWQFSDNSGTTWQNIPVNGTSSSYLIAVDDAGDLIRVTFTASGSFTGTQTSEAFTVVPSQEEADNADIASAKAAVESATYKATQAEAGDTTAATTKAQALVDELGTALEGTTVVVVPGVFTAAVAGDESTHAGTKGSFTFTVSINKGEGTAALSDLQTMSITATVYEEAPTYGIAMDEVVGGIATVTIDPAAEAVEGATVDVLITDIEEGTQFKSITVTDADAGAVETTTVSAGTAYTFTMPQKAVMIRVEVEATSAADSFETVIEIHHPIDIPVDQNTGMVTGTRLHRPFIVTTHINAETPIYYQMLTTGQRSNFIINYYRINEIGVEEHYFSIELENATMVGIQHVKPNVLDPENSVYGDMVSLSFVYDSITWTYVMDGTVYTDVW